MVLSVTSSPFKQYVIEVDLNGSAQGRTLKTKRPHIDPAT